jgi:Flp pilus assembly protein TadG
METTRMARRADQERGAILVHTAIAMFGLFAFSAIAIDYGAFWLARSQAQNAADAAAHAGASSLAWDDPDDIPRAQADAVAAGQTNLVLGAAPSILTTDITLVPCPPGAPGLPDTCVRADVFRSAARANALPTFFAQVMGINSQDIRATATAQIETGNATECLKPWAVADKWAEHWENGKASTAPWTPNSNFDKYVKKSGKYVLDTTITTPDVYIAPTASSPGTGFAPFDSTGHQTADYGLQLTLKFGDSQSVLSSGWFLAIDLLQPNGTTGSGADDYRNNIKNCNGTVYKIGDTLPIDTEQGKMVGPTKQGVEGGGPDGMGLTEKDPGATWDPTSKSVTGSCAPGVCADGKYYARSPRIVPVALFDVDAFFAGTPTGKTTINITNIMGFFVEGMCGSGNKDVCGRLVAVPGLTKGGGSLDETASFLRKVIFVR